jgi:serine/threonine protein phosphatase PrpC
MPKPFILTPEQDTSIQKQNFGAHSILGGRRRQEDALAQQPFEAGELGDLTPEQIGQRLWTSYHELHAALKIAHPPSTNFSKNPRDPGTTASTTVIHQAHLITATLADSVAFAVIYGQNNSVLAVERLNKRTHSPALLAEKARIEALGGLILQGRVMRLLAISRAIGAFGFHPFLITDADINITSLPDIAKKFDIDPAEITRTHLISTCDGYTEKVVSTKKAHEDFLSMGLSTFKGSTESELAAHLTQQAAESNSRDNISVAVQTITSHHSGMLGVYDGHDGTEASHFVANHISETLLAQCAMSEEAYASQMNSVQNNQVVYDRDNNTSQDLNALIPEATPSNTYDNAGPLHDPFDDFEQVVSESSSSADEELSGEIMAIHQALLEKLTPLRNQYMQLEKRATNPCETIQSKQEIRAASTALRVALAELSQRPAKKTPQAYIRDIQEVIHTTKEETQHARGIFSLHRMLQRLSDWLTACIYQKQDIYGKENTQRFFKTTTENTLNTLSDQVSQMNLTL